ncbi:MULTISPECIES: HAD family hydrolase [unclassified Dysgonomonas]|uniref:HAD family hydrolase n=1 Tax=unclassified Dysgonomonas TaxID=2630389 RepID=UPI0013E9BD4F|nr:MULTISPECIES: HAD family phosphatase [unclassified Dysgonomonas]
MAESKITTILLGLDGVVVDTESYYDKFWNQIALDNGLKIDNFSAVIKGMTINSIIELYFAISTPEEKQAIRKASSEMEQSIPYKDIMTPGLIDFIKYIKKSNYKLGLVTSSPTSKVGAVLNELSLNGGVFDTIITSDSIKRGKPDPMGYVLASTNLGVHPSECAVFEDSFTGIKAATYAFMRVIGISTTLSADFLKDYSYGVIEDFKDLEKVKALLV